MDQVLLPQLMFFLFSPFSQHNERHVKQSTLSIENNIGIEKQIANIVTTNKSRKEYSLYAPLEDFLKAKKE